MNARLHALFEKTWRDSTRVLFGRELAGLEKYDSWLSEYLLPVSARKSAVSGREVILAKDSYPKRARFVSSDEVVFNRKYSLGINEIKDIDSIAEPLQGQFEYTGNRILGNSASVESSDIVMDSQFVYGSTNIEQSSYIYKSYMMRRGSRNVFGSGWTANGEFLARVVAGINLKRCFESHGISDCSDLYFSFYCQGCHEMLFSFGQKNRSHCIGNLALPKDKYRSIKSKLLSEAADSLEKNGRFDSLFQMVSGKPHPPALGQSALAGPGPPDMAAIERSFASAMSLLLGKPPANLKSLEKWLGRHTIGLEPVRTVFGTRTYRPLDFGAYSKMPMERMVTTPELFELGKSVALGEESLGGLERIRDSLGEIAYFTGEFLEGENRNIIEAPIALHSVNVYKGYESTYSENTGMTSMSLHSKFAYGCNRIIDSQFCVDCYNSLYLNRCFEMDSCTKCTDSLFCHNSEGLQDCMFCFNMKGSRHCIGNNELPKGKYASVRSAIAGQIAGELAGKKSLGWDIYSIGAGK